MNKLFTSLLFLFSFCILSGQAAAGIQNSDKNSPLAFLPHNNLLGFYKMDGDALDSTANNDGDFVNGPFAIVLNRDMIPNSALYFNGSNQYISTVNSYDNPNSFTLSIWFKTNTNQGGALIGFSSNATGNGGSRDRFIYMTNNGRLYFGVAPGRVKHTIVTTNSYNDNQWHLVTATLGNEGMKLFVDGELAGSNTSVKSGESYTGFWRIGHDDMSTWPEAPASFYFKGALDDAAIYTRQLAADEVRSLFKSLSVSATSTLACSDLSTGKISVMASGGTAPYQYSLNDGSFGTSSVYNNLPAGEYKIVVKDKDGKLGHTIATISSSLANVPEEKLISHYPFDGNTNDSRGVNPGTAQKSPVYEADRFGNATSAIKFNGSNQYVSTSKTFNSPNHLTMSLWFKTTTKTGGVLMGFGRNLSSTYSYNYDRVIYISNSGQLFFGVYPGKAVVVQTSEKFNDGKWHHVIGTLSTDGMKLYVDGQLKGLNVETKAGESYEGSWTMGYGRMRGWPSNPSSEYFNGSIDDVTLYGRSVTASEVSQLHSSATGAGNNGPVCAGSGLQLTSTAVAGATYSWTGPGGFTSSLQNPVRSFSAGMEGNYTVSVNLNGCTLHASTTVSAASTPGQWTGMISNKWNMADNWCDGVIPSDTTDVTIPAGANNMPVISGKAVARNLNILNGASLTTTANDSLFIHGNLSNNGNMINEGTTVFAGKTMQAFSGVPKFHNLVIGKVSSIVLPENIEVNTLYLDSTSVLKAGNFDIDVKGNWINYSGSTTGFDAGTGKVKFTGTQYQQISGGTPTIFHTVYANNEGSKLTLANNVTIKNLLYVGGVFDLQNFFANGTSANTLYIGEGGVLRISGTNSYPTGYSTYTFLPASTVEYYGTTQTIAGYNYGNLILSSFAGDVVKTSASTPWSTQGDFIMRKGTGNKVSFTANSAIEVGRNFTIETGATFNGGSVITKVGKNWKVDGTFNGQSGTVIVKGAGATVSGSGVQNFNHLTVEGAGISFANNSIKLTGNLKTTGSGSFVQDVAGTLTMTGVNTSISGLGITLGNFNISGSGTVTIENNLAISGNLNVNSTSNALLAGGTVISLTGSGKTLIGSGIYQFKTLNVTGSISSKANFSVSSLLNVEGSFSATAGKATLNGAATTLNGTANLFNVEIANASKLTLTANSVLGIAGTFAKNGVMDALSSAPNIVHYNGTNQAVIGCEYYHLKLKGGIKNVLSAFVVKGDFEIEAATSANAGSFNHTIEGDWINRGTFNHGNGTITIAGSKINTITGATTFNLLDVNRTASFVSVNLNDDISVSELNMNMGNMNTGSSFITITKDRTGPGIIMGNIKRSHTFTTGKEYAFEGPNNTIGFSSLETIPSSITVSVEKREITDFPNPGAIRREYKISFEGLNLLYSAKLRLHYEDDELNGFDESQIEMWKTGNLVIGGWSQANGNPTKNAVANYVEMGGLGLGLGLLPLDGRWTLSSAKSKFVWKGTHSTQWHNAANWSDNGSAAMRIPNEKDNVEIGVETFNHQPVITTAAVAKTILFGDEQQANLVVAANGSLTTGDIKGTWNKDAMHTIETQGGDVQVKGNVILSNGTAGRNINLTIGNGAFNIEGNLIQDGGAGIATGSGTLRIGGDYQQINGTFNGGTGSVIYNGTQNQNIAGVTYYNLEVVKATGSAFILNPIIVNGNLKTAGLLEVDAETVVKGDVNIFSGANLTNQNILHVGGNWNNAGTFTGLGMKVVFDGEGTQLVSKTTLNHIEVNKPVGSRVELTGDVLIKGNLIGTSGTLDMKTFKFDREITGGTVLLAGNGTLIMGAQWAPRNFSNYTLHEKSTIIFNSSVTPQSLVLPGLEYGNLVFANAGPKSILANITVKGDLTIESGATVTSSDYDITLLGNWENSGAFVAGNSTIYWNGANHLIIGSTTFNKVVVRGKYEVKNNMEFGGSLEVKSSGIVESTQDVTYTMHDDFINSGSLSILGEGIFSGTKKQTLRLINAVKTEVRTITFNGSVSPELISSSKPNFGILNINNTGGIKTSVGWDIISQLNVSAGASFDGGKFTHNIFGSMQNQGRVISGGVLNFVPMSTGNLNFGSDFESTGTVVFGSSGAITISGTPKTLTNVIIENTNASGVEPASDWTILGDLKIKGGSIMKAASHTYKIKGDLHDSGILYSGTSTFIFNGTGVQDLSSLSVLHNITINNSNSYINLLTDVEIRNELQFIKGVIYTGEQKVRVLPSGIVTGASANTGWVNGYLNKHISPANSGDNFEVGDNQFYTPVKLSFGEVSPNEYVSVRSIRGEHAQIHNSVINAENSVNRWYDIKSITMLRNFSATFHFVESDLDTDADAKEFGVARFNGSSWSLAEVEEAKPLYTKITGMNGFGEFALGEICNRGTSIAYSSSVLCTDEGIAPIIKTGTLGGIFAAEDGLEIDSSTGSINLVNSVPGNYTVSYNIEKKGSCEAFSSKTRIKVGLKGVWSGVTGSNWNDDENWSCKVPAATDDVTIPSNVAYFPVITEENAVHHLHILPEASLIVEGVLTLLGNIHNEGELDMKTGTLEMAGANLQQIPVLKNFALKNLLINNSSSEGVANSSELHVLGGIEFKGKGRVLHTNNQLTLRSTNKGTAWVGDLTDNMIEGDVTVERYLSSHKAWRLLSVPTLTGQDVKASWMEGGRNNDDNPKPGYGVQITSERGTWQADGFDLYSRGGPSMKMYNSQTNKWVGITSTYNKIETDRGYMVFVRGNRQSNSFNSPVTETVLRTKGPLRMGDQTVITTIPNTYTVIGNPYAAQIDFSRVQKGDGIDNSYYVWDPFIAGNYNLGGYQTISATNNYKPVPGGSIMYPTGKEAKVIPSGSAFLVHSSVDDGTGKSFSLQMKESVKTTAASSGPAARNALSRGGVEKRSFIEVTLYTGAGQSAKVADGNVVAFDNAFSNGLDGDDALKMIAEGENFAIKRNGKILAVEARNRVASGDTIQYYMTNLARSTYQLRFAPVNMEYSGVQPYLVDSYLQTSTPVSIYDSTFVDVTVTAVAGSAANDRFKLVFRPMAPLPVLVASVSANVEGDAVVVTWKTENEVNMKSYELERSYDGGAFVKIYTATALNRPSAQYKYIDGGASAGVIYYRVKILDENGTVNYSEVVKVKVKEGRSGFSVYPNPVENGQIHLFVEASKGKVQVRLLNELGQQVMQSEFEHLGGSVKKVISVDSKMAHGIYHLEVSSGGLKELIKLKY